MDKITHENFNDFIRDLKKGIQNYDFHGDILIEWEPEQWKILEDYFRAKDFTLTDDYAEKGIMYMGIAHKLSKYLPKGFVNLLKD